MISSYVSKKLIGSRRVGTFRNDINNKKNIFREIKLKEIKKIALTKLTRRIKFRENK